MFLLCSVQSTIIFFISTAQQVSDHQLINQTKVFFNNRLIWWSYSLTFKSVTKSNRFYLLSIVCKPTKKTSICSFIRPLVWAEAYLQKVCTVWCMFSCHSWSHGLTTADHCLILATHSALQHFFAVMRKCSQFVLMSTLFTLSEKQRDRDTLIPFLCLPTSIPASWQSVHLLEMCWWSLGALFASVSPLTGSEKTVPPFGWHLQTMQPRQLGTAIKSLALQGSKRGQ